MKMAMIPTYEGAAVASQPGRWYSLRYSVWHAQRGMPHARIKCTGNDITTITLTNFMIATLFAGSETLCVCHQKLQRTTMAKLAAIRLIVVERVGRYMKILQEFHRSIRRDTGRADRR